MHATKSNRDALNWNIRLSIATKNELDIFIQKTTQLLSSQMYFYDGKFFCKYENYSAQKKIWFWKNFIPLPFSILSKSSSSQFSIIF